MLMHCLIRGSSCESLNFAALFTNSLGVDGRVREEELNHPETAARVTKIGHRHTRKETEM